MAVEPEKAKAAPTSAMQTTVELAGERIERDLKILRDAKIARGVGEQRVGESDRDRAAGGEAVEAVGEIDRVRRADDDEREKDEREPRPYSR